MSESVSHIRFVVPRFPDTSGGATVVENLMTAFRQRGITVDVVSIYPGSKNQEGASPTGADDVVTVLEREDLHRYPVSISYGPLRAAPLALFKRWDRWRRLSALRRTMATLPANSVVIYTHVLGKMMVDESGFERSPTGPLFVGQHHSSFASLDDEPWLREALPKHFADCDAFVALSDEDAASFGSLLAVPCVAIPNPAPEGRTLTTQLAKRAVALARFSHEKQIPLMVRLFAAAITVPEADGWSLAIYGDGVERPQVAEAVERSGMSTRIELAGVVDDSATALSDASLNLLTSSLEGFPMTILEAACSAVPSIAFDCSAGVRSQLENEAGYLVHSQNEDAYVAALRGAMLDDIERRRRGENARARAERYAPSRIVDDWLALTEGSRRPHRATTVVSAPQLRS
ncbi:glycosyltransferase [Dermacoccus nishinomiyaensis]|uniref:glycosyltransferase n=1 Tax=Dermacoccus nishinomiyaensis TaxID=1274 RepID=UPI0011A546E5|nr:glycosyltransferase [Dermacoccus nishinomiyaensis]